MGGVYCILNKISRKMYIGSTNNLTRRRYEHFSQLRNNKHVNKILQDDFNNLGEHNFSFIELIKCSKAESGELEERLLHDFMNGGLFYNVSKYASGGRDFRGMERMRKHITHRGRTGVPVSLETRAKMSKAHTGSRRSIHTRLKMRETNANKARIRIDGVDYPSMSEAARILNISRTTITNRINSPGFPNYQRVL